VFTAQRPPSEQEVRRRREQEASKKASREAAARKKAQEQVLARQDEAARRAASSASTAAAYEIPAQRTGAAQTGKPTTTRVGAAMARIVGGPSAQNASDWRKAIVLNELLMRPVSMRTDGERAI